MLYQLGDCTINLSKVTVNIKRKSQDSNPGLSPNLGDLLLQVSLALSLPHPGRSWPNRPSPVIVLVPVIPGGTAAAPRAGRAWASCLIDRHCPPQTASHVRRTGHTRRHCPWKPPPPSWDKHAIGQSQPLVYQEEALPAHSGAAIGEDGSASTDPTQLPRNLLTPCGHSVNAQWPGSLRGLGPSAS